MKYFFIGTLVYLLASPYKTNAQPADSTIFLDAVKVEAYQMSSQLRSIPGSISMLKSSDLKSTDGTNLSSALNTLPGVNMQSGTFTTNRIIIRGMGSRTPYNTNRLRTYLNDIPLTGSDGLSSPEEIDLMNIGRIEIIKGPSSALYGSGLGGSINLYTPVSEEEHVKINFQYGSFNTLKANLTGTFRTKNFDTWSAVGQMHSDGYRENSRYDRTSLMSFTGFTKGKWSMNVLFMFIGVHSEIPSSIGLTLFRENPQAAATNWKNAGGFKKYVRGLGALTISRKISDHLSNKFIFFGRGIDSYERRPFNNLDDQSLGAGIRNKLTLQYDKLDVVLGAEWIAEGYTWKLDTNKVTINQNRENRNQFSLFSVAYFRPVKKLNVSVAGAINYIGYKLTDLFESNGNQHAVRNFPVIFSPRLGINYTVNNKLTAYFSAGHGFSLPSPEETLLPDGDINHGIKHEQGWQFEAGSRAKIFRESFRMDVVLYWIELNDLLVTKRITEDIFTGINAGKTRHQGAEILVNGMILQNKSFPGQLDATLSFARSWNHFIDFSDAGMSYDGKQLPGIPVSTFYGQISWSPAEMISFLTNLRYTGEQFLDDANQLKNKDYIVLNLKMDVYLFLDKRKNITISAGINNTLNERYASMLIVNAIGFNGNEPRYFYPGLPRHAYFGINYIF